MSAGMIEELPPALPDTGGSLRLSRRPSNSVRGLVQQVEQLV